MASSSSCRPFRDASVRHLVVAESEHVADLVDDGVADLADGLAARLAGAQDRAPEDGDLRGQAPTAAASRSKKGTPRKMPKSSSSSGVSVSVVVLLGRLFLDDHDDVLEVLAKLRGHRRQRLLDEGLELGGTIRRDDIRIGWAGTSPAPTKAPSRTAARSSRSWRAPPSRDPTPSPRRASSPSRRRRRARTGLPR